MKGLLISMTKLSRVGWTATLILALLCLGACAPQKTAEELYPLNNPELLASIGARADEVKRKRIAAGTKGYMDSVYEYISAGELNKAIKECEEIRAIRPNDEDVYIAEGYAYHEKEDYPAAISRFSGAISIDPAGGVPYFFRAKSYFEMRRLQESLDDIDKGMSNRDLFEQLVSFYRELDADGNKNLTAGKMRAIVFQHQALAYGLLGKTGLAIASADKAISEMPTDADLHFTKGLICLHQEKYGLAYRSLENVIELNPESAKAWYLAGLINVKMGSYNKAILQFQKADELDPLNVQTLRSYGLACWLQGNQVCAFEVMGKALRGEPDSSTYFHLAYFNHLSGFQEKALKYYEKAYELNSDVLANRISIKDSTPVSSPTRKFYEDELGVATMYLEKGKMPAQTANDSREPKLEIVDIRIDPNPVPANTPFDFHVSFDADIPGLKEQVIKTVLSFEILRGDKTLLTSKPLYIEVDNGGSKRWTLHMNPVSAQGTYTLRVTIKYNDLISEKDTSLVIN